MKKMLLSAGALAAAAAAIIAVSSSASAQTSPDAAPATQARPSFAPDGTVHVPAFDLPPSQLSSKEAQEAMKMRARMPGRAPSSQGDIAQVRSGLESMLSPQVAGMRKDYPADVQGGTIAGVPIRTITPQGKPFDQKRVLINLHGGGFTMCADACALLESLPIAVVGGFKVVTVDYRMAPEAKHPAALEDVTAVYRELLKSYKPKSIGIYGCSAGGALTGEAASYLPAHGLPEPGAIGIFGAGGVRFGAGDSAYVAGYADGSFAPPPKPGETATDMTRGYFSGFDMSDATISPAMHPDIIAKFPPTLIITGTRAMDMSPAIYTNTQLLKAGVRSELIVGEGMGHCFIYQSSLPEARDAYQVIVSFFRDNLAGK
jgi:monoterpene epsilon-lactone hydrolase